MNNLKFCLAVLILCSLSLSHQAWSQGERSGNFVISDRQYHLPDIELLDQTGGRVNIAELVAQQPRTIISFIFTSCPGICPMITANMARSVPDLRQAGEDFQILLISVDPEHDTPGRLADYAERFRTGPEIRFLTGTNDTVFQVMRSLDALYEGSNRMNHQPITLISSGRADLWRRIDGLIGSDTLIEEYRKVVDNGFAVR